MMLSGYDYAQFIDCPLSTNYYYSHISYLAFTDDCKKLLLANALGQSSSSLLLGGDFIKSILGNPAIGTDVFGYINSHPCSQIISRNDLRATDNVHACNSPPYSKSSPYSEVQSTISSQEITQGEASPKSDNTQSKVHAALVESPDNQITDLAWQVYGRLVSPTSPDLSLINSNYLGAIGEMITAANWFENPTSISSCSNDLDFDVSDECLLANRNIFVIVEPDGGIIPFVFTRDHLGVHQIIGPTWEFIVGLSDPFLWDTGRGLRSDADQLLGAFTDPLNN